MCGCVVQGSVSSSVARMDDAVVTVLLRQLPKTTQVLGSGDPEVEGLGSPLTRSPSAAQSARLNMGAKLAKRIQEKYPTHHIDVVIPIPGERGRSLATSCVRVLVFVGLAEAGWSLFPLPLSRQWLGSGQHLVGREFYLRPEAGFGDILHVVAQCSTSTPKQTFFPQ